MGSSLKEGHQYYHDENVAEKLKIPKTKEKNEQEKRAKIIQKVNDFCGITSGQFDPQRCMALLSELFKRYPEVKKEYEAGKEAFKKSLVLELREHQYTAGLLSDLAYMDIADMQNDTLPSNKIPTKENINTYNKAYIITTLKQKGFRFETVKQYNIYDKFLNDGFSGTYIENNKEDGFFLIRGTDKNWPDKVQDILMGLQEGDFHWQTSSAFQAFEKIVPKGKKVSVYGHSLGGHLAQAVALKYYDRIEEVITYDAPGLQDTLTHDQDTPHWYNKYRNFNRQNPLHEQHNLHAEVIHQLLSMQEHPFMITNIVTETNNEANRIGTRIGQNIILDKTQYHALSDINNHLADMPLSNIHTWQEKNEIAIANAHKEVWCENISKINFPYCREKLSLLKQQYANNPEALKILENTEKNLDITKTKNEVATYASTMNIDETAMHFVDKKFFTLNSQEKYRFIVNYFFENPNNPHILTLLSLYHLEKNGYGINKIKNTSTELGLSSIDWKGIFITIMIIPHQTEEKQIIYVKMNPNLKNTKSHSQTIQTSGIDFILKNIPKNSQTIFVGNQTSEKVLSEVIKSLPSSKEVFIFGRKQSEIGGKKIHDSISNIQHNTNTNKNFIQQNTFLLPQYPQYSYTMEIQKMDNQTFTKFIHQKNKTQ